MERSHQVILSMLVTKDIDNTVFDYILTWYETLASIAWTIRAYYHRTNGSTPGQDIFSRDMILNLTSVVDWRIITAKKQQQVDIDNVRENSGRVMHDCAVGKLVYA